MSAHDRIPIVPAARALGADPLAAETALAYSLGLVLQPVDRLYVTIDAYQIEIDDRIVLSSNLLVGTNPAAQELLENLGINGVTALRYFNNEPVFQNGTLDQGWWPDGLNTPPPGEAMTSHTVFLKKAGFNMHSKHTKLPPAPKQ